MKARKSKRDDTVTTTVAFDRATYRQLGHMAVDQDTTVRELVRRAVDEYLRRHLKGESKG